MGLVCFVNSVGYGASCGVVLIALVWLCSGLVVLVVGACAF